MLTDTSYMYAIYTYLGSGFLLSLLLIYFVRHWLTLGIRVTLFLMSLSIFLIPAYPADGVTTMAPAVIVAVFQFFINGFDAAAHAIRPLTFGVIFSIFLSFLLLVVRSIFFRRRK